jgi:hypothetical protein
MDGVSLVLFSSTREREDKGFYHFYKKEGKWVVHDGKLDQLPFLSFATNVQFEDIDLEKLPDYEDSLKRVDAESNVKDVTY